MRTARPGAGGPRGGWSGIIAALCSARSARRGHATRRRRRPAALTLRQKSTCSVCSARPCAATAASVRLVTRAQFSRHSTRRRGQQRSRCDRQSSVTWPHPDSVTDARLGHLWREHGDRGPGLRTARLARPWPRPCGSSVAGRQPNRPGERSAVYRGRTEPSEFKELAACNDAARI